MCGEKRLRLFLGLRLQVYRCQITALIGLCGSFLLNGCVAYRPRPLNPPQLENQYRTRVIADPKLRSFIETSVGPIQSWPPLFLDLRTLSFIGYYYSPELEIARSQVVMAEAGIRAAGARINPILGLDIGYDTEAGLAKMYGILPAFTIETGGKRGARILQAERQAEAARVGLAEAGWRLRSRIRNAFYDHLFAVRRRDLLQIEESVRSEIVQMFDKRLAVGEASRPELDVYRVDLITTQAALQISFGDVEQTRAELASAVGLPLSALEGFTFEAATLESPPGEDSLPILKVQKAGLLHRADLRRMLAEYAASDAALKLEVARQYPNLVLTPGYTFEEGFVRYVLNSSIESIPLFHHNQGPIEVAEAERRQVGERFEALQAQAIGQMETALVQYRAALNEWQQASERLISVQRTREEAARRALAAGEGDRLTLSTVRLQTVTADRGRLDALRRVSTALGALEDAMQQPLQTMLELPDPSRVSPRKGGDN